MRYHYGLGVGHTYARREANIDPDQPHTGRSPDSEHDQEELHACPPPIAESDPEVTSDHDTIDEWEGSASDSRDGEDIESDDDAFLEMEEMYN